MLLLYQLGLRRKDVKSKVLETVLFSSQVLIWKANEQNSILDPGHENKVQK